MTPIPPLLALETSEAFTSVALLLSDGSILKRESNEHNDHAEVLTTMMDSLRLEAGLAWQDLGAIGVSQGPGSYTGLRIGYATAKGLCLAANIPLVAISTLAAISLALESICEANKNILTPCCFVPMIDARRMEVYTQTFLSDQTPFNTPYACILTDRLPTIPSGTHAYYAGSGAAKARDILNPNEWTWVDHPIVRATDLLPLLKKRYLEATFENLAYAEPLYVKDFEVTPARRNPLAPRNPAGKCAE